MALPYKLADDSHYIRQMYRDVTWSNMVKSTSATQTVTYSNSTDSSSNIVWENWNRNLYNVRYEQTPSVTGNLQINDDTYIRNTTWTSMVQSTSIYYESVPQRAQTPEEEAVVVASALRSVGQPLDERIQRRVRQAELRDRLRRMANRRAKKIINKRAEELLQFVLTKEEYQGWRRYNSVRIHGQRGIWEIGTGWSGMLYLLSHEGKALQKLCCHPSFEYPTADRVAAMVLALRANEEEVYNMANVNAFSDKEKRRVEARRGHKRTSGVIAA